MISETDTIESIRSRRRMKVVALLNKDNQVLLSLRIGEENPKYFNLRVILNTSSGRS